MPLSRALSIPAALALAGSAAEAPTSFPANAVLLFVADWCAPCHGEVARLDEIAGAARPRRVLVIGMDAGASRGRLAASVPDPHRWRPDPEALRRLRAAVSAASAGLPYSVATDARGRACADSWLSLTAARTRALVAACGAP